MKILIELSKISFEGRLMLAKSTSDENVLKALSEEIHPIVRRTVAENTNATYEVLLKLSKDEDWQVRKAVAGNINVTSDILLGLSEDVDYPVIEAVLGNAKVTPEILLKYSKDKPKMREIVARNTRATTEILLQLSKDEDLEVRKAVANNANATFEILQNLLLDRDPLGSSNGLIHLQKKILQRKTLKFLHPHLLNNKCGNLYSLIKDIFQKFLKILPKAIKKDIIITVKNNYF